MHDYWNVDGEMRIIRCMDRLHKIHLIERTPPDGKTWSREETYEETNNLKTRQCMARYVEAFTSDASKSKAKAKDGSIEKPKTRQCHKTDEEKTSSGNQTMKSSSVIMKATRRKLEVPMTAAMACKTPINGRVVTPAAVLRNIKTKYACIVEADESMRIRLVGDTLQGIM